MVFWTKIEPGEEYADWNCPCVEEHAREESCVCVGFDDEEVAFDITSGKDEVLPSVSSDHSEPSAERVLVDRVRGIDDEDREVPGSSLSNYLDGANDLKTNKKNVCVVGKVQFRMTSSVVATLVQVMHNETT